MNLSHFYSDKPAFQTLEDIKDKNVLVMGLGLNGGGEATVRFLLKHGANVTIKSEQLLRHRHLILIP